MMLPFIPYLLHVANSSPPHMTKREFYRLKEEILEKYGTPDGYDVQHIKKDCWGPWEEDCPGANCRKCWGTGVYSEKWIKLDRFKLDKYVFHIPAGLIYDKEEKKKANIQGYIEHKSYGRSSKEAALWLYLLFGKWGMLWRGLTVGHYVRWSWHPMLCLNRIMSDGIRRIKKYKPRKCPRCERIYIKNKHCIWMCRKCHNRREYIHQRQRLRWPSDSIPF